MGALPPLRESGLREVPERLDDDPDLRIVRILGGESIGHFVRSAKTVHRPDTLRGLRRTAAGQDTPWPLRP
jgi:hypothetical protein